MPLSSRVLKALLPAKMIKANATQASLQAKVAVLEAQIASTESQIGEIRGQLK